MGSETEREKERDYRQMHIKFVASCNRSGSEGKSLFFIMQSTLAYEATARTLYIHSPAEYPFAGVRIKANTDKSIINARLHTQRETAKKRETH